MPVRPARTPLATIVATTLAAALIPATASAATLSFDRACQLQAQPVVATLTGFTPGASVVLASTNAYGGTVYEVVPIDAAGNAAVTFSSPVPQLDAPGSRELVVTATDSADPALVATAAYRTSTGTFTISGRDQPTTRKRTWAMSGFTTGRPVYAHFRLRGKLRGTFRLGTATGPCGELTASAAAIPIKLKGRIPSGEWKLQLDHERAYSPSATPRMVGGLTVSGSRRT